MKRPDRACRPFLIPLLAVACTGEIVPDAGGAGETPLSPVAGRGGSSGTSPKGDGKQPDPPPGTAAACRPQTIAPRVWRLDMRQYRNTVAAVLGGAEIDLSAAPGDSIDPRTGFGNGSEGTFVGGALADALYTQAEAAAALFDGKLPALHPCLVAPSVTETCLRDFLTRLGRKAFRRPVTTEEVDAYAGLFQSKQAAHGARGAIQLVVQAMLLSPSFLYRTELGDGAGGARLTGHEIASALSYDIADLPPSDDLMAAADAGKLTDPAVRAQFARTLLETPSARDKFADFIYWQLGLNRVEIRRGEIADPLVTSVLGETRAFVKDVLSGAAPTLNTLFAGSFSFVDSNVAPLYGLRSDARTPTRVALPADQRFGLFTQPAWLMSATGPIHRGRAIREAFLCMDIPPPPNDAGDLTLALPKTPAEWTEREKWDVFVAERAGCAACHKQFQPLGIAFEAYDAQGRYRTHNEHGRRVGTDGEISDPEGWSGKFATARDLVNQILNSEAGQSCFAQRYMTYALGWPIESATTSCATRDVSRQFAGKLDLRELVAAVAASDLFVNRSGKP